MTAKQSILLARTGSRGTAKLSAILIGGMHAVVSTKAAEAMEGRGVYFSWLYLSGGKTIAIPNRNDE